MKTLTDFLNRDRQELALAEKFCAAHAEHLDVLFAETTIRNVRFWSYGGKITMTLSFPTCHEAEVIRLRYLAVADFAESYGKALKRKGEEYEDDWDWHFSVEGGVFVFADIEPRGCRTLKFPARDSREGSIADPRMFASELERDMGREQKGRA